MTTQTPDIEALAERVERLERQNRQMKQTGIVAVLGISALLLTAQTPTRKTIEANVLVAKAFVLTDQNGMQRAELSMTGGAPGLSISGTDKASALLAVNSDGPFLLLSGPQGELSVNLDLIQLSDRQGFRSVLGVTNIVFPTTGESHKTSAAALTMFDKEGKLIWQAP